MTCIHSNCNCLNNKLMEIARLQNQIAVINSQLAEKQRQVEIIQNELNHTQQQMMATRIELGESQSQVINLGNQLDELRLENYEKSSELKHKDNEIEILKRNSGEARGEILNVKIRSTEEKLETLIQQLGVNREQIRNLRIAYKQLIKAHRNSNQNDINIVNNNVNNIGTTLGINPENTQKLCRKCEKLVILRIELDQIYQAQQEVPLR
jgi:chromosome segregation ATPase